MASSYNCTECTQEVSQFADLLVHYQQQHPGKVIPKETVTAATCTTAKRKNRPSKAKRLAKRARTLAADDEMNTILATPHPEEGALAPIIEEAASPSAPSEQAALDPLVTQPVSPATPVVTEESPAVIMNSGELQQQNHYIKHARYRGADGKMHLVVHTTTYYIEV